ncbi:flagellar biosynthesis protein FlhB [Crateriforma conspicua]|uniref:Flagellar biosynthetic protein FlhB n=1 Tax=Crateriforma conspicua TaxID=2527996 RepID=A0A5C5Y820_9PLAN|nr:flagellar biosynthesis protein FlhB [Crateriforma conspicua]QDV65708.1 Flagellar biosynthetic protein FlhB [Crateriforma conspicua]TWT71108.1 Flagellar biosynthetic protein FlhB [Crateriforma conspicua]
MADSGGDKKHFATDRKRRQAREKGQVVKSQDLASALMLLSALAALWFLGDAAATQIGIAVTEGLSKPRLSLGGPAGASRHLMTHAARLGLAAVPFLLVMFAAGVLVNVTQVGLMISPDKLVPKLSNISPLSGAKRIFSLQGVMRLTFGLFKVAIIGVVAFFAVRRRYEALLGMATMTIGQVARTLFQVLVEVCLYIGAALTILAILEYAFQKWKFEQDLMMTDQELRDEMKETEGDPQVAARRRQVQRQIAMNEIGQNVPKADVVVSNPTELAIAIQYDPVTMPAPVVLAKGAGVLAQRIRRVALENGIPVVERKPLAQFLYKNVETGDVVPPEQYQAVAEVLRYVYQLQGRKMPQAA